ncbi:mechanosensitive ion channel family protein [Agrobacterium tumefaciens]|uniref:mechanosensitive ion channel family protein n=1 Tax=Agrobacterium tumefaciens TaxID=358 RepID=UPI0013AE9EE9|nr:mechanosensitive ion channel family protein [Agrobacterium tumefaciens]NTA45397.1 mechanosensitive ion channel family protein [Agrobacterium tumefaciens]UXT84532.1 mechanosensitive ion channel family protein [Agrobacterium tumefaciens]WIE36051.1 mechanosensitive ion channel family protein [Agrobacterium tumefaciens]
MKNRLQSLFDAERAHFLDDAIRSYIRRIGFPPNAGRDIAKKSERVFMKKKRARSVAAGGYFSGEHQRILSSEKRNSGWKAVFVAFAVMIALLVAVVDVSAQPITVILRQGQSDAEISRLLAAAAQTGRPIAVEWQYAKDAMPTESAAPVLAVDTGESGPLRGLSTAFVRGAELALDGLSGIAGVFADTERALAVEGQVGFTVLGIAVFAIALGGLGAFLFRRIFPGKFRPRDDRLTLPGRMKVAITRFALDLVSVGILVAVANIGLRLLLEGGTLSFQIAAGLVTMATVTALYAAVGRIFLAPLPDGRPLVGIARPRWHLALLIAYGAIGSLVGETVRLADARALDKGAIEGWFLIGTTVLTLLKLWWFIAGRRDIRDAFIGTDAGAVRRVAGYILPDFYAISALAIWLAGLLVAGTPNSAAWSFAAGTTQIVLIAVPIIALGSWSLLGHLARNREAGLHSTLLWGLRTAVSGGVWLIGLHLIVTLWQPLMSGETEVVTGWFVWLEHLGFAVVASWTLCSGLWQYFDMIAPTSSIALPGQEEDEAHKQPASRMSTVMPVIRNLTLGAVLAIAALLVLSSTGINVAPLLAGFGVLGLALSFGSQTLVKDVVSGIFFIADDAFRIGEYIDTGGLMGTVEHISLRSIRLRHHNGPIHTIPFGQIDSVTNYSRDWGTIKFELRFERDADAELIRKTAKKVGLAMLEDPEFGPEFLVPLKMQGIQTVTETSMVVRFKFTSRPGNPSILKREGMKRLLSAFKAAGLSLASNAVTVRSGAGTAADAAAAAMPLRTPETTAANASA